MNIGTKIFFQPEDAEVCNSPGGNEKCVHACAWPACMRAYAVHLLPSSGQLCLVSADELCAPGELCCELLDSSVSVSSFVVGLLGSQTLCSTFSSHMGAGDGIWAARLVYWLSLLPWKEWRFSKETHVPLPLTLKLLDNKPQRNWNFCWNLVSEGKEIALESTRAGTCLLERGYTVLPFFRPPYRRDWSRHNDEWDHSLIRAALCIFAHYLNLSFLSGPWRCTW